MQTLIATAIDEYVAKRQELAMDVALGDASGDGIDRKLVGIVECSSGAWGEGNIFKPSTSL